MKAIEQINRECAEMWDALNEIPFDDPDRDAAIEQAHAIEAAARREYEDWQTFWRKSNNGTIRVDQLIFTAKPLEEGEDWMEFGINQIGVKYSDDDVFYVTHPIGAGEPIACFLSTMSLKVG